MTHPLAKLTKSDKGSGGVSVLGGGKVKQLYTLNGEKVSIRVISRELGVSRDTVCKYIRSPELPKASPRPARSIKLDPYKEYITTKLDAGVDNCVVLLDQICKKGMKAATRPYKPLSPGPKYGLKYREYKPSSLQIAKDAWLSSAASNGS